MWMHKSGKMLKQSLNLYKKYHYFFHFSVDSVFFKIKVWEEKGNYDEDQEANISKAFQNFNLKQNTT